MPTSSLSIYPDMQTLSRMTGKDFSGPTPEIRAPVRPNLSQLNGQAGGTEESGALPAGGPDDDGAAASAKSTTPGPSRPSSRASNKKSKKTADDGVEVLGSIDNEEWE